MGSLTWRICAVMFSNDAQMFTSVILYINIILSHSDCLVAILVFYTVPMFLHAVRNFVNQKEFQANTFQLFTAKI